MSIIMSEHLFSLILVHKIHSLCLYIYYFDFIYKSAFRNNNNKKVQTLLFF